MCSYKRACKYYLGGSLQLDVMTFCCGENCGCSTKTFLLSKALIGCQHVYQILHYLCHFQASHQEARLIHPSSYSQEVVQILLYGLHV
jgi:hypothetical protein